MESPSEWEHLCAVDPKSMGAVFNHGVVSLMTPESDELLLDLGDLHRVRTCQLKAESGTYRLCLTVGRVLSNGEVGEEATFSTTLAECAFLPSLESPKPSSFDPIEGMCSPQPSTFDPPIMINGKDYCAMLFAAVISRGRKLVTRISFGLWSSDRSDLIEREEQRRRVLEESSLRHLSSLIDTVQSFLSDLSPKWVPDGASLECHVCAGSFSVIKRRHHCRSCGALICSSCSRQRRLPSRCRDEDKKAVRVCTVCALLRDYVVGSTDTRDIESALLKSSPQYESTESTSILTADSSGSSVGFTESSTLSVAQTALARG